MCIDGVRKVNDGEINKYTATENNEGRMSTGHKVTVQQGLAIAGCTLGVIMCLFIVVGLPVMASKGVFGAGGFGGGSGLIAI